MALTLHYDFVNDKSLAARVGPTLSITRATTASYVDSGGLIAEALSGVARFTHDSSGTSLGLLVEEARTNICLYSEDMSNAAWVASNVTKGSNASVSPDGSTTADRLTASAGNGTVLQSITSASTTRSFAVYIRRVTGTGDIDLTVDGGSTWTTVAVDGTWTRFDIQQAAVTNPQVGFRIVTSADAIDVWGAQLEAGAFPTSYIPTTTASVTRNADKVENTAATGIFSDTAGTLYLDGLYTNGDSGRMLEINTGNDSGALSFNQDSGSGITPAFYVRTSGGLVASPGVTTGASVQTRIRAVGAYAADDAMIYVNGTGGTPDTDTGGTTPTSLDEIHLGKRFNDSLPVSGLIKEIRYYDERLDDTILAEISTGDFSSTESSLQERRRHIIKRRRANAALARPRKEVWAGRPVRNPKYR